MKVTFLGTGTSYGVPVIGCDCEVCQSKDPRNHRTRASILIETDNLHLLIDTATEFRLQALRAGVKKIDAVLYTHCHADHVFGFDDLRAFSYHSGKAVPFYGNYDTIAEMLQVFGYVFRKTQVGGGKPLVKPVVVDGPFQVEGVAIIPVPAYHGNLPIYGYRIGDLAYITDCSRLPQPSLELLTGLKVLILGVIRYEPHPSHMHVDAALELVAKLKPQQAYFTHVTHLLDHETTNSKLPEAVSLAYDGLIITI
ncbi:MAG: MBL fold metallo-hydrolase [Firmicutes bacterium]|nr:MBL fold metallo-hydrolase [Bacillota bacterium]NLL87691.1 MBL fold metallo-hydrolase [Bacillota bacterium]HKM16694.1 MBL fold metallo-hydrolase [Limnochordia bacterium]